MADRLGTRLETAAHPALVGRLGHHPTHGARAHTRDALLVATRQNIEQITGGLSRISDGTYGACQKCHERIPAERLAVLPHARFCVPYQEKQNR
ncbi:TraR/DksA C4-type zinc finger protein [Micromonospora sp. NPDC005237]|uniref:TraR/DksA family transcriptional regulator n=1 Tax=Micromonospora sp. NPDC005237 TaxID=3155113 RepID=UPI0033A02574